jgi:tagatose-1,6-bisphosphate aldolase non-catalytic subunit AgaZ/GatZ
MVFHVGIVERVYPTSGDGIISAEQTTEALVWMWDENLIILKVHPGLAAEIREGDYVLADYYPTGGDTPNLRRVITKILRGREGEEAWQKFREYHRSKNRPASTTQVPYG